MLAVCLLAEVIGAQHYLKAGKRDLGAVAYAISVPEICMPVEGVLKPRSPAFIARSDRASLATGAFVLDFLCTENSRSTEAF